MEWLGIGGGVGLGLAVIGLSWYAIRSARSDASMARSDSHKLAEAQQLAVKVQSDLADCADRRTREARAAAAVIRARDKELSQLRFEIEETEKLITRMGGPDLVIARLRKLLRPKTETTTAGGDSE